MSFFLSVTLFSGGGGGGGGAQYHVKYWEGRCEDDTFSVGPSRIVLELLLKVSLKLVKHFPAAIELHTS